ncbi:MAG: 2,3-bisphosphoglycerate-independent phosphoglycerate mutase [Pyrinomonadaceae bacterium]|nr:2,3-bisphosphoglycerate-independent phosphoglycerate mutase [Pyrinomonadaceae bacterium]
MKRPLALIILDGWGYSSKREGNAIALANTPNFDQIRNEYPMTLLVASGERVGLPRGSVGNSEIGHLCLGTGRVSRSQLERINYSIQKGSFFKNKILLEALEKAKNSSLHLIGMVSDGNVHSSQEHLFALLRAAKKSGVKNVFVHATLDGVDVPADSADIYIEALEIKLNEIGIGKIATICGRHFTMDKSNNLELTARAYTMLTHAEGERGNDAVNAIREFYQRSILDEKIEPIVLENEQNEPIATLKNGDVAILFNFRGDRLKQLAKSLISTDSVENSNVNKPQISTFCLTDYDEELNLPAIFPNKKVEENSLAQVLADNGILNCRISEAEKYSHITYFFNGRVELEHPCEQRILVTKKKAKYPEKEPEIGSYKITDRLLRGIEAGEDDVFIVNFSAADVLANTGNLEKTIEAIQHIDNCLGGILEKIREFNGILLVTSSYGNCEEMLDENNNPNSSATTNSVPFYLVDDKAKDTKLRNNGSLEDVSPTILAILGVEQPDEMTGKDLRM